MRLSTTRVEVLLRQAGFSGKVKQPERHGIPARWKAGCRCELCKNARRDYRQAEYQNARKRAIDAWEAGEHSPGPLCPCPACRKAAAVTLSARLERTQACAVEHGQPWTADEDEKALDRRFKIEDIARSLGRTYAAVANRRRYLARKRKNTTRPRRYAGIVRIIGTFRDPDGIDSDVVIERDEYPDDAVEQIKELAPEGCALLHVKIDR